MADQLDTGLALSGGGYRAMLFALGSLWRLNECGWLRKLDVITSVSGGSITNGVLATRWKDLEWSPEGVALNFKESIATPIMKIAGETIDVSAGISGMLSVFSSVSDKVAAKYDAFLFHGARLQKDIPGFSKGIVPRFLFYATSLQTGSSVRIERKRLADYKIGEIPNPDLPVAMVVAASSAFPPFLSPVRLKLNAADWRRFDQEPSLFDDQELRKVMYLTDGGVYDNMGLQAIWDRCRTVLVCDAGAPFGIERRPSSRWTRQVLRVLDVITEQTRALRRSELIETFKARAASHARPGEPAGAYWGIKTKLGDYGVERPVAQDSSTTEALQHVRTRLARFTVGEQGRLINFGYALADSALRRHVDREQCPPAGLPVPEHGLA